MQLSFCCPDTLGWAGPMWAFVLCSLKFCPRQCSQIGKFAECMGDLSYVKIACAHVFMSQNNSSIVSFCCVTKISQLEPRLKFIVGGREIGCARTFQSGSAPKLTSNNDNIKVSPKYFRNRIIELTWRSLSLILVRDLTWGNWLGSDTVRGHQLLIFLFFKCIWPLRSDPPPVNGLLPNVPPIGLKSVA